MSEVRHLKGHNKLEHSFVLKSLLKKSEHTKAGAKYTGNGPQLNTTNPASVGVYVRETPMRPFHASPYILFIRAFKYMPV